MFALFALTAYATDVDPNDFAKLGPGNGMWCVAVPVIFVLFVAFVFGIMKIAEWSKQ